MDKAMMGDALAIKSLKSGHLEERFVLGYICAYNMIMNYEWDKYKAKSNYRKHGVDFADAVSVFNDDDAILILDDHPDEERFATLGMDSFARILVVVQYGHTFGSFRHVKPLDQNSNNILEIKYE